MRTEEQSNRFKDAPWFPQHEENVIVGGAGGIGSWLSFFLSRAGFQVTVYDFDTVEESNLGGQLFRQQDVGSTKVSAVLDIVKTFAGDNINGMYGYYDANSAYHRFMFSAFDNMHARKVMFESWKRSLRDAAVPPIFIDGRLEMEHLTIFAVTPENIERYEQDYLFDDSEVDEAPCTMRQTTHTAAAIASDMVAVFTNHISNIYMGEILRSVPFKYERLLPAMFTDIEY